MNARRIYFMTLALAFAFSAALQAQETIGSDLEGYYDFLALRGFAERPYLNYRTLSDSVWKPSEGSADIWSGNGRGTPKELGGGTSVKLFGSDAYFSYNSTLPAGQNDGALWQGRGLNSRFSTGARLESRGLELTLKPELVFSQNQDFDILPSAYESDYGYIWGYSYGVGVDAPQRFGDQAIIGYSWGDSELRYTWKNATVGIGTQYLWLGPAKINSLMHSNNAPPYPKADVGLRRTAVTLFGHDLGDVEARLWAGYLTESGYFDSDSSNDRTMISGLALAYAPSILEGLTLSFNRTYLAQWDEDSLGTIPSLILFRFNDNGGGDVWDQRLSLGFDYLLPAAGAEFYAEAAWNDNPGKNLTTIIKNFSHTMVYTVGLRKAVAVRPERNWHGEIIFEWSNLEMSPIYSQVYWANSFYMHSQLIHGYTNGGQWLGAGIGTGGNSQYLGFTVYHPEGSAGIYLHRYNPDNDFLIRHTTPSGGYPAAGDIDLRAYKAVLTLGVRASRYLKPRILVSAGLTGSLVENALYDGSGSSSENAYNLGLTCGAKYVF